MIKVAVTDFTFPALDVETSILQPLGCDVVGRHCQTAAELIELVADAEHVITQFARLDASVIGAMQRANIIVRYGIGVDNVDLSAAAAKRIPVCNVPDYCIDEVADHTLAFILSTTRQVMANCLGVRRGQWRLATALHEMRTLRDLTVGIVGLGRIGRAVARRLAPFGCRVLAYDPVLAADDIRAAGCVAASFDELVSTSDVVTLHCPSTPQTRQLFNSETFSRLKSGAIFVNVGRGDLVESAALVAALREGRLSAAGLDVFDPEPIPSDSPLLAMENVIVSSHIASASVKAARKLRETAANLVARAVRGEPLINVVNGVI